MVRQTDALETNNYSYCVRLEMQSRSQGETGREIQTFDKRTAVGRINIICLKRNKIRIASAYVCWRKLYQNVIYPRLIQLSWLTGAGLAID